MPYFITFCLWKTSQKYTVWGAQFPWFLPNKYSRLSRKWKSLNSYYIYHTEVIQSTITSRNNISTQSLYWYISFKNLYKVIPDKALKWSMYSCFREIILFKLFHRQWNWRFIAGTNIEDTGLSLAKVWQLHKSKTLFFCQNFCDY